MHPHKSPLVDYRSQDEDWPESASRPHNTRAEEDDVERDRSRSDSCANGKVNDHNVETLTVDGTAPLSKASAPEGVNSTVEGPAMSMDEYVDAVMALVTAQMEVPKRTREDISVERAPAPGINSTAPDENTTEDGAEERSAESSCNDSDANLVLTRSKYVER